MNYIIDGHCHTISSGHAYSTVAEYAKEAAVKGLEIISITDHAPAMPGSAKILYFQNLRVLPTFLDGVRILKGVEVNILNHKGELDLPDDLLNSLDYVVACIHPPCYSEDSGDKVLEAYINVMKNPAIDVIGHPDDGRYPMDYEKFVKAAKEYNKLIEVNNSSLSPISFRANAKQNYLEILKFCKKYNAPIIVCSDAHFHKDIGNFKYANEVLNEVDFPKELIINYSKEKLCNYLNIPLL